MKTGIFKGDQFTPYPIGKIEGLLPLIEDTNISSLQPSKSIVTPTNVIYFFMRYLAGGKNLKGKFAEIDLVEFINHISGKLSKEPLIKAVAKQTRLTVKGKESLSGQITIEKLVQLNQLINSNKTRGIRKEKLWVGNIKTNANAFEACDYSKIKELLNDFLIFLNDNSQDILKKLIIGTNQFAMIHPFMDGNGRVWRCLFWHLLSPSVDEVQCLLLITYFKLINRDELYKSCKELREGRPQAYVKYWVDCIDWSNKALDMYYEIMGHDHLSDNVNINQIVQLDYYLKSEKRYIN